MQMRHRKIVCFIVAVFMIVSVVKVVHIDDTQAAEVVDSVDCSASAFLSRDMLEVNSQLCTTEMLGSRNIVSHIRVGRRWTVTNFIRISHIFLGNRTESRYLSYSPFTMISQDISKLNCEGILMSYIHNQDGEK